MTNVFQDPQTHTHDETIEVPIKGDNVFTYMKTYKEYGISGIILIILAISLLGFLRRLATRAADKVPLGFSKFFKKNKRDENLFRDIENNIITNIHNLHYICKLRRLVVGDALIYRMEAIREEIYKLIDQPWYFEQTKDEFANNWGQLENNVVSTWRKKCESGGIFDFVIDKMDTAYTDKVAILKTLIDSVCRENGTSFDIIKRTDNILDLYKAVQYSLMVNTLEDTLSDINGELAGRTYKGVTCPGPDICTIKDCPSKNNT